MAVNPFTVSRIIITRMYKRQRDQILKRRYGKIGLYQMRQKPWMWYRESEIVEEILRKLQPMRCLEWGAGYSTISFPRNLPSAAKWFAVEHKQDWVEEVHRLNQNPNTRLFAIPPDQQLLDAGDEAAAYQDYVHFPTTLGTFDFILVDGRARNDCIVQSGTLLADQGVLVVHDANRPEYDAAFQSYPHQVIFNDFRTYGGLWIGSKSRPINTVLDVPLHRTIWKVYRVRGLRRWVG